MVILGLLLVAVGVALIFYALYVVSGMCVCVGMQYCHCTLTGHWSLPYVLQYNTLGGAIKLPLPYSLTCSMSHLCSVYDFADIICPLICYMAIVEA